VKTETNKLKMHSPDITKVNIARIAELFPNCITETKNENGNITRAIDFDQLRQELSDKVVEGPRERYQLDWPGKREGQLAANAPIAKTLRPAQAESVHFSTTRNLFIEGDNLEALKLLRETYVNRVKMIYIDPPYNTGKNRLYPDDFAQDAATYFNRSHQREADGTRLIANAESNGRYHSDWLSMIYPRLRISRELLTDDGVLFVSIGDHEVHNIRHLCDEVFGRGNFLAQFVWRTDGNFDNQAKVKSCHEYILAYARNLGAFPHPPIIDPGTAEDSKLFNTEIRNTIVKNGPRNPVSEVTLPAGFPASFDSGTVSKRDNSWPHFKSDAKIDSRRLIASVKVASGWSSKDLLLEFLANGCKPIMDSKGQQTTFEISRSGAIEAVKARSTSQSHVISVIGGMGGSQKASAELEELGVVFEDYPKPTQLIRYFAQMQVPKDYIVLDFFAGSATTGHAIFQMNAEDGGRRQVIACQLPELLDLDEPKQKAGAEFCDSIGKPRNISEIAKERLRRAGRKVKEDAGLKGQNLDVGFRVLKVDTSNMKDVYYRPDAIEQETLQGLVDNVKDDRSDSDLLFQVLLDWGVDLTLPINTETIKGKKVHFVDKEALAACFEPGIDEPFIKDLAKRKPLRAVFRDNGYGNDATKINVEQIFKLVSPGTEVKTI